MRRIKHLIYFEGGHEMPALGQLRNDSFMSPFDIIKDRDRVRKTVFYGRVSTEHS